MTPIVLHHDLVLLFAVVGFVYAQILMSPGELLSGWYKLLERLLMAKTLERNGGRDELIRLKKAKILGVTCFTWNKQLLDYEWLFKILGGCYRCCSGQMALWGYLGLLWYYNLPYNLIEHLYVVSGTILLVSLLKPFYQWMNKRSES